MYVVQFLTATWTLDKMQTQDILKFRQATWDPPPWQGLHLDMALEMMLTKKKADFELLLTRGSWL